MVWRLLEVDGALKSGSGTILRLSVALAAILNTPLHIYNIRRKRPQPGLKPQHLKAVLTAAKLCGATLKGAGLGSQEVWFHPTAIVGGNVDVEIGTAGSIPMLLITVLPICAFATRPVKIHVTKGGTDVTHSPTINYLRWVFLPTLAKMGLQTTLKIHRYGYYPKGLGEVSIEVQPNRKLEALNLESFGRVGALSGVSVCTFLADRQVAERQRKAAAEVLGAQGYDADIEIVNDFSNRQQKGSSLTLRAETNSGAILGSDAIGELRKTSEAVGCEAAHRLLQEIAVEATVDVNLADMLIPYMALVPERSAFFTRALSNHTETNMWLAQEILGVHFATRKVGKLFSVEKLAS